MSSDRARADPKHWQELLRYAKKHPCIITNRHEGADGKEYLHNAWKELTFRLNSLGLGVKDIEGWKRSFCNWKSTTKAKAARLNVELKKTGGGKIDFALYLTSEENRFCEIIGLPAIIGDDIPELGVFESSQQIQELQSQRVATLKTPKPTRRALIAKRVHKVIEKKKAQLSNLQSEESRLEDLETSTHFQNKENCPLNKVLYENEVSSDEEGEVQLIQQKKMKSFLIGKEDKKEENKKERRNLSTFDMAKSVAEGTNTKLDVIANYCDKIATGIERLADTIDFYVMHITQTYDDSIAH